MPKSSFFSDTVPLLLGSSQVFQPATEELRDGSLILFDDASRGSKFTAKGWGAAEPGGTWSVARSSSLAFLPVTEGGKPFSSITAAICFVAFTPAGHGQRISISCDGEVIANVAVTEGDARPHIVMFEFVDRASPVSIEFGLPDCIAPSQVMESQDGRLLGIQLRWLSLAVGDQPLLAGSELSSAVLVGCEANEFAVASAPHKSREGVSVAASPVRPDWTFWPPTLTRPSRELSVIDFRSPQLDHIEGFEGWEAAGRWITSEGARFSFSEKHLRTLRSGGPCNLLLVLEPFAPKGISPDIFLNLADSVAYHHRFRANDGSLRILRAGRINIPSDGALKVEIAGKNLARPFDISGEADKRQLLARLRAAVLVPCSSPLPPFTYGLEVAEAEPVDCVPREFQHASAPVPQNAISGGLAGDAQLDATAARILDGLAAHVQDLRVDRQRDLEHFRDIADEIKGLSERLSTMERGVEALGKRLTKLSSQVSVLPGLTGSFSRLEQDIAGVREAVSEHGASASELLGNAASHSNALQNLMKGVTDSLSHINARQFALHRELQNAPTRTVAWPDGFAQVNWQALSSRSTDEMALLQAAIRKLDVIARREIVIADENTLMLHAEYGYVLVPRDDMRLVLTIHDATGFYERSTQAVFAHLLRAGMTAVDVGANVGLHSLCLGRLVGTTGKVWAIEPAPRIADLLKRTIAINALDQVVTILPVAAGREPSHEVLHVGITSGHSSLLPLAEQAGELNVPVDRLDNLVPDAVDLVKIDAEGMELAIVEGMSRLLENESLAIVAEFGFEHLQKSNITAEEWSGFFRKQGFESFRINEGEGPVLVETWPEHAGDGNYLFIRDRERITELLGS